MFYVDEAPGGFADTLEKIDAKDWVLLHQCRCCDTLWAIDEWDKYAEQVVVQVSDSRDWTAASDAQRKDLMLKFRGGTEEEECIWVDCGKLRVRGVEYCIDHLYATGARR